MPPSKAVCSIVYRAACSKIMSRVHCVVDHTDHHADDELYEAIKPNINLADDREMDMAQQRCSSSLDHLGCRANGSLIMQSASLSW